jgi:hypothetical protein
VSAVDEATPRIVGGGPLAWRDVEELSGNGKRLEHRFISGGSS